MDVPVDRYDLIVVDEAHHARRRAADLDEYRPSRLLQLLDRLTEADHARAMWLLTATPMQIHPIELLDLQKRDLRGPAQGKACGASLDSRPGRWGVANFRSVAG